MEQKFKNTNIFKQKILYKKYFNENSLTYNLNN